jgi:radical SAM protein with 4Fe4S-binding SPASM domain
VKKYLSDPFFNMKDADFLYKSKVFAGILSRKAFVGPYIAVIGDRYRCNYRCIFCEWFSPIVKKVRKEIFSPDCYMDMDVYRGLVRELSVLGTKIILIGNNEEPFTDPQLIEKIKYAKHYNLGCFLITNGSLIDEENAEKIVDLKLDYLNVSINAGTAETYPRIHTTETEETFERITSMVSIIEKLKEKKRAKFPRTRLSMVVCNRNYHDIVKFVGLCQELGVKNALIKRFITSSKEIAEELELTHRQEQETRKYLVEALKSAKKYGINVDTEWAEWTGSQKTQVNKNTPCYYGWLFSVIDADGNVYPCCFQDRSPSCAIGNIRKDNFRTLWLSKKYQDFRRKFKNIDERRQMGYLCNQPSCFFNNKQVYEILHKPYFLPVTPVT